MRSRLYWLLTPLIALGRYVASFLRPRRWTQWSLRSMLLLITALGIWLGMQVNWLRERQAGRVWIEAHEIDGNWSRMNPKDVVIMTRWGTRVPEEPADAPLSLRIFGESRLAYIYLDKSKLSEEDFPLIDSLPRLFPEAQQVQVVERDWTTCWPPADRRSFLKYPTRIAGWKVVNEPIGASPASQTQKPNR